MSTLDVKDYGAFLQAVHGHATPYPWQERLLRQVVASGWPSLLDLPTGVGKTTALDIAVFHMALDATAAASERRAPRRAVLVVDRRVVVDQAYTSARRLAEVLAAAREGVVREVADRLRDLGGQDLPLQVALLRGGMVRDETWARTADQPLVAVSTVDQVGSRLLFRGYGVSPSMRPVHAGLLGNDALILLDEVHLSPAFRDTLEALAGNRVRPGLRAWADSPLSSPWQFVKMSATSGDAAADRFALDEKDHAHPGIAKRTGASKLATLKPVHVAAKAPERDRVQELARACADEAKLRIEEGDAPVLGVVVNRVDGARHVAKVLREQIGDTAEIALLTGRMRPLDRDDVLFAPRGKRPSLFEQLNSRGSRRADDPPLVVVSTQAIEAGADFDLDALVTECASLDALRQRFGRVDRAGELEVSRATILIRSDQRKADDPVYGGAIGETWSLLESLGKGKPEQVDMGVSALDAALSGREVSPCLALKPGAPILLPATLDAWVQTRPAPEVDPDPALWLHGPETGRGDVQVIWRSDVDPVLLEDHDPSALATLIARLSACPPVSVEALSIPISAARAWLRKQQAEPVADVEAVSEKRPTRPGNGSREGRSAVVWRGDKSTRVHAGSVKPGDTLVVPISYGGLRERNWDPGATAEVADLGDRAQWVQRRRPTLRLRPGNLTRHGLPLAPAADLEDPDGERAALDAWLESGDEVAAQAPWLGSAIRALREHRLDILRPVGTDPGERVMRTKGAVPPPGRGGGTGLWLGSGTEDLTSDEETSSFTETAVGLKPHLEAVGDRALSLAGRLGLPQAVKEDVALAARLHDLGKADPRFQRMLRGGSEVALVMGDELLAKSETPAADRRTREVARRRSGYPRGTRHELTSLALMSSSERLKAQAHDWDLVCHLVASHHGFCRPLAPPVPPDEAPVSVSLDLNGELLTVSSEHGLASIGAGIAERFWRLVARYGWYGLAWLETMVRLADHRESEAEQQREAA